MNGKIDFISYNQAKEFLSPKHYSGRTPSISFAFGWYINESLVAVCTFGKPASNSLCIGVCGEEYSSIVYELNRLCRVENLKEQLSYFVSNCLRCLKNLDKEGKIIVSYSDTAMNHRGYIYQATNFLYTGITRKQLDNYAGENKHSRHARDNDGDKQVRSPKHRYIFFAMSKKKRKKALKCLTFKIEKYPKGDNSNYKLGEFIKPEIIKGKNSKEEKIDTQGRMF